MKKRIGIFLILICILSGCTARTSIPEQAPYTQTKQYTATYLTLFDTVTTILGRAESEEAFQKIAQSIHDELEEYHQLFDIYNTYEGVVNLKTVNEQAGIAPVKVDERILHLLADCKDFYDATQGNVNVAMGSVLQLWHETRSEGRDDPANARLPEWEELKEAQLHTDLEAVILDEDASTVYISDPLVQLDVGAIAKGWSVQQVAEQAPLGLLISVGGNVCATGPKDENGTPWVVGIQDPDDTESYLHTIYVTDGCVVTSGDYQRAYWVDGKVYHHIIDPDTLYPSEYWRSVTIVCEDSGAADALSTALFLLPIEEGQELLKKYDAEALWVAPDGEIFYSPGFEQLIRT